VKAIWRYLAPVSLLILCAPFAGAQTGADLAIGFGTAHVSANSGGIDNLNSTNALGACTPNTGDPDCQSLPSLSGLFMGFQGNLMLNKRYGFGGEANFQPSRENYGPLQSRQIFYDFNGVYAPINEKSFAVTLQGGIGGARTSFILPTTACVGTVACTSQNEPLINASHFQVHVGVGVSIYVKGNFFIRPQFDFHFVPGLNNQFSSNAVPEGTVWVGYAFGRD
jgi:hypothetical protein